MNDTTQASKDLPITIPVIEEQVTFKVQSQETGKVRITKQVREEVVEVDEPVTYEKVDIERVPINEYVDTPPSVRYEEDVTIIPVLREVMVKRILLVEELHVRKTKETSSEKRQFTLRKEEVQIQRDPKKEEY